MPGRARSGEIIVADIGIPEDVLNTIEPRSYANTPMLWLRDFPWPRAGDHKYTRGHAVVAGGTGDVRRRAAGVLGGAADWGRVGDGRLQPGGFAPLHGGRPGPVDAAVQNRR